MFPDPEGSGIRTLAYTYSNLRASPMTALPRATWCLGPASAAHGGDSELAALQRPRQSGAIGTVYFCLRMDGRVNERVKGEEAEEDRKEQLSTNTPARPGQQQAQRSEVRGGSGMASRSVKDPQGCSESPSLCTAADRDRRSGRLLMHRLVWSS